MNCTSDDMLVADLTAIVEDLAKSVLRILNDYELTRLLPHNAHEKLMLYHAVNAESVAKLHLIKTRAQERLNQLKLQQWEDVYNRVLEEERLTNSS